jgi:hypothetical protein
MRYEICLAVLLASCATRRVVPIDYDTRPPSDWPRLQERITKVSAEELQKSCSGLGEKVSQITACAVTDFATGTCGIYMLDPTNEASLEHERAHCRGYGHVGHAMAPAVAWQRFKASGGKVPQ